MGFKQAPFGAGRSAEERGRNALSFILYLTVHKNLPELILSSLRDAVNFLSGKFQSSESKLKFTAEDAEGAEKIWKI
jgi:hypothetical protein